MVLSYSGQGQNLFTRFLDCKVLSYMVVHQSHALIKQCPTRKGKVSVPFSEKVDAVYQETSVNNF